MVLPPAVPPWKGYGVQEGTRYQLADIFIRESDDGGLDHPSLTPIDLPAVSTNTILYMALSTRIEVVDNVQQMLMKAER